jgi:hypothetical protein
VLLPSGVVTVALPSMYSFGGSVGSGVDIAVVVPPLPLVVVPSSVVVVVDDVV